MLNFVHGCMDPIVHILHESCIFHDSVYILEHAGNWSVLMLLCRHGTFWSEMFYLDLMTQVCSMHRTGVFSMHGTGIFHA